jgi:MEMO1 family protein
LLLINRKINMSVFFTFLILLVFPHIKGNQTDTDFIINEKDKQILLQFARKSIDEYSLNHTIYEPDSSLLSSVLKRNAGVFITLRIHGTLRGCVGTFQETKPLYMSVRDMAIAASNNDYRFKPVRPQELKSLEIEISVITPMKKISSINEIKIGEHGICIKKGTSTGILLPQVAIENKWTTEEFLGHCSMEKAKIGWNGWKTA